MILLPKLSILSALFFLVGVNSLMFHLEPNARKCLKEEVQKGVLVKGEYEFNELPGQKVGLMITDTKGHHLYNRETIEDSNKGAFAFTSDDHDIYEICFISRVPHNIRGGRHEVFLKAKHGVEAKSYEGLGDAAKLKPLEVELKRLEDLSESIVQDFAYMRQREEEMRDTNESTNSRVLYFSLFSMCCLLGLATWQVLYLRKFFKSKKLIE
eukprot:TRINITY_DN10624_c0_g1_i1.p1 TRINITY_DN10624_c0_g1~~TRINITY_DN10624_c0_g1_i1.p1  ORF type:complete len:211 (+),score=31.24 TRINITY_DN10624_c0_g1_i1:164-796(+)